MKTVYRLIRSKGYIMEEIMKLLNSGMSFYAVSQKLGIEPQEVIKAYEEWRATK
jgi:hypothetical protein